MDDNTNLSFVLTTNKPLYCPSHSLHSMPLMVNNAIKISLLKYDVVQYCINLSTLPGNLLCLVVYRHSHLRRNLNLADGVVSVQSLSNFQLFQ